MQASYLAALYRYKSGLAERGPYWCELAFPWEIPSRWHPLKRWRYYRRQRRITALENLTGVLYQSSGT